MSSLSLSVGEFVVSIEADDTKAEKTLRCAAANRGYSGHLLDTLSVSEFILDQLKMHLEAWASQEQEETSVSAAREQARNDPSIKFE